MQHKDSCERKARCVIQSKAVPRPKTPQRRPLAMVIKQEFCWKDLPSASLRTDLRIGQARNPFAGNFTFQILERRKP
jgi:hypothetical protein